MLTFKKFISVFSLLTITLVGCDSNNSSSNISSSNSVINTTNISYLTSEDKGTATIKIYKDNNSTSKERYIAPKNVNLKYSYNDLNGILANNENVCPSKGNVNLLVIPVHIPGDEKYHTEKVRNDIEKVFFGKNDDSLGFKSLSEYYYESSFGQLNFQGIVTDWFDVKEYTNIKSPTQISQGNDGTIVTEILRKAVAWASSVQKIDLKNFDNNQDGSIDGVWLVYDHLDWKTEYELKYKSDYTYDGSDLNTSFWNFTSWDWETIPNLDKPTTSGFSWSSFSSMYAPNSLRDNLGFINFDMNVKLDSHIYIHETGHLLGLEDYYANDDDNYHPMGKATMMDQNICDFDSYSKLVLGWITPYVVYGTSEILIPSATSSKYGAIVIPSNYQEISDEIELAIAQNRIDNFTYEFNPFSEYLLIDLYTPDGLNYQDTTDLIIDGKDKAPSKSGVRIYHVDSRLFKAKLINYDGGTIFNYVDGYEWDGYEYDERNEVILMPISNQKIESTSFQLPNMFDYYDQVRLLEAIQTNTFSYDGYLTEDTLFTPTTKDFDISSFAYQFFNANYGFNNGNELPFKINIKTLKEVN